MAIDIKYDPDKKILRITITGPLIPEEITSAFQEITRSSEYPVNVDALWDLRETDFHSVDEKLLRRIIEKRVQFKERSNVRAAFIVSTNFAFGITRMYEALSVSQIERDINIFKSYSEGEQWLLNMRLPKSSSF